MNNLKHCLTSAADVSFARSIGGLSAGEMDADQVFDVNMSNFNESKLSFGSSSTSRGGTLSMGGAITGLHTNPTFTMFAIWGKNHCFAWRAN